MPNLEQYVNFSPDAEIPSLAGKVIFITGGTAGIGRQAIFALAKHQPAHIYFTGRNAEAAKSVAEDVRDIDASVGTTFIKMDMNSMINVRQACAQFVHDRLDILIANAGVMYIPEGLSAEGYENHFAINHLAHAVIIRQLLPALTRTAETVPDADVRVVLLTSTAWGLHAEGGINFKTLNTAQSADGGAVRYGQSKLANLVYASSLAQHVPASTSYKSTERRPTTTNIPNDNKRGILFVSAHPGAVATALSTTKLQPEEQAAIQQFLESQDLTLIPEHQGAWSMLWAAAGAPRSELVSGGWYMPVGRYSEDRLDETARSDELRDDLWHFTENVLDEIELMTGA